MTTTTYEQVRRLVQVLLQNEKNITTDVIAENIERASKLVAGGEPFDAAALSRELEAAFNVWIPTEATLDGNEDHVPWLPERRLSIKWSFWNRYRRFLEEEKRWPPAPLERLSEVTDRVLERLEDPERDGAWDRRGMVVGQVQSGKTANYSGLICKAADAGYKLIVVLAGLHNNLRSQTQLRLDEGFLGFDTERNRAYSGANRRVGVGLLKGEPALIAHSLTSSADLGDFNKKVADQAGIVIGGADPVLLVVKKNKSVLQNLFSWATDIRGERDAATGKVLVRDVPLLVIDDEADNASVNTQPVVDADTGELIPDADPSTINKLIRQFLSSFEKRAYVGYTATPFANIFIHPDVEHSKFGDDLFPRSFIITLPEPSNYVGPVQVFGLPDEFSGQDTRRPLPIVKPADDYGAWIPDGHKKDLNPGPLPPSLLRSLKSFLLSCATRIWRGQEREHMSMLIHVTRFTDVQRKISEQISTEMSNLRRQIEFDGKNPDSKLMKELKQLWERDFVPTSAQMEASTPAWKELIECLPRAATKITVRTINGNAEDILDYSRHPGGLSVIAIGGDKLSRGLTLEGLSVSYYLRSSKMYDTLMQMGRWFGYRPGYLDLCRLYTTEELIDWYEYVTLASEELRREFDYMAAIGKTPRDFGLRVRSHPAGLVITAANKMKTGTAMTVSYAGAVTETIQFERSSIQANLALTERFVGDLGRPDEADAKRPLVWQNVDVDTVQTFLRQFLTHPAATKARAPLLTKYIDAQVAVGELSLWTVVLVSKKPEALDPPEPPRTLSHAFGPFDVGLTHRKLTPELGGYTIKRLLDPSHELIDLDHAAQVKALEKTIAHWKDPRTNKRYKDKENPPTTPGGTFIRQVRSPERGLLLIYPLIPEDNGPPIVGFGISFPDSDKAQSVEYVVNNTYWEQLG
jgi:hypothetical protein